MEQDNIGKTIFLIANSYNGFTYTRGRKSGGEDKGTTQMGWGLTYCKQRG